MFKVTTRTSKFYVWNPSNPQTLYFNSSVSCRSIGRVEAEGQGEKIKPKVLSFNLDEILAIEKLNREQEKYVLTRVES